MPVGFKPVWLIVEVPRIGCASCGLVRRIELGITEPRRRHTKAFERFILALTKTMTMLDVPRLLGVGWDLVKDTPQQPVEERLIFRRCRKEVIVPTPVSCAISK